MDRGEACNEFNAWSPAGEEVQPGVGVRIFWVALSACASVMLLATTNQISQEISVISFLWVLPLALYLLSFILCFSSGRWYSRIGYVVALFIGTGFFCSVFYYGQGTLLTQIGVYSLILFVCCMICHGELARLKPHPHYLTLFYVLISTGGLLGGISVNLIAPNVFPGFWELPVGLLACWVLLLIAFTGGWSSDRSRWFFLLVKFRGVQGGILVLGVILFLYVSNSFENVLWSSRNFYGVLRVKEINADTPRQQAYALVHNTTVHGFQYLEEEKRLLPTAYYAEESGMGLAILHHPQRHAGLRVLRWP